MSFRAWLALATALAAALASGCATCRSRADAWVGRPIKDALVKFGPPDVQEPIGPNERYTWVRSKAVGDPWASYGRTSNPLKSGGTPRGEQPSARPIEPTGGGAGMSEHIAALLVSPGGTVLNWSGTCEAFAPPSGFMIW